MPQKSIIYGFAVKNTKLIPFDLMKPRTLKFLYKIINVKILQGRNIYALFFWFISSNPPLNISMLIKNLKFQISLRIMLKRLLARQSASFKIFKNLQIVSGKRMIMENQ